MGALLFIVLCILPSSPLLVNPFSIFFRTFFAKNPSKIFVIFFEKIFLKPIAFSKKL